MRGRGLRSDIRCDKYAKILDADPVGARGALRDAAGPAALTAFEYDERAKRKPCKIFTTEGRGIMLCERCGHDYAAHKALRMSL